MFRSLVFALSLSFLSTAGAQDSAAPFPLNRVRDFYAGQARAALAGNFASNQTVLPQFPGLDGGAWGHWGQNPENENVDNRLNEVDTGGLLMQVTSHFGNTTLRAVNVRVGKFTVLFDPDRRCFIDGWEGGLPEWQGRRYGITSGVRAKGQRVRGLDSSAWKGDIGKYHGFYRVGDRVMFSYDIGDVRVFDVMVEVDGELRHRILCSSARYRQFSGRRCVSP